MSTRGHRTELEMVEELKHLTMWLVGDPLYLSTQPQPPLSLQISPSPLDAGEPVHVLVLFGSRVSNEMSPPLFVTLSLTRSARLVSTSLVSTNVFNTLFRRAALTLSWLDKCQKWRPLHLWTLTSHSRTQEHGGNPGSERGLIWSKGEREWQRAAESGSGYKAFWMFWVRTWSWQWKPQSQWRQKKIYNCDSWCEWIFARFVYLYMNRNV